MKIRNLDKVSDGAIIDKSIGQLSSGSGQYGSTKEYESALLDGRIGQQATPMSKEEVRAAIRSLGERYEQRSLVCDAACERLIPGPGATEKMGGATAIVGGGTATMNDIPVRGKLAGTTPGTSAASVAAREIFGNRKIPGGVKLPAPTSGKPLLTSGKVAPVVGRTSGLLAIAGGILSYGPVRRHDIQVRQCMASCYSVDFSDK